MREWTLAFAYYENRGMLAEHCRTIARYPQAVRDCMALIVVDDGSPKCPAHIEVDPGVRVSLFRMLKDVRWNQDACRNLAVRHLTTEWVLLTDADHLVPADTAEALCKLSLVGTTCYRFSRVSAPDLSPYKPHPNSWFMTRTRYWRAGGYDERFAGWYGTDADFRDRVTETGAVRMLTQTLIRVPREVIPDASTTTYERKTERDGEAIKRIKRQRGGRKPKNGLFQWVQVL